jgi:transcriptional regulator with XRE-family HTH domain
MEGRVPTNPPVPPVRREFARRLRQLRIERGFMHARKFSKTLGIEENRYTRYERAEVEPTLTLIHRMCEVLEVTPNDLFGFTVTRRRV